MLEVSFNEIKNSGKDVVAYVNKQTSKQMSFGRYVESNLITALEENADKNNIKVYKMSKAEDYLFGADLKLAFKHPTSKEIDGLSTDIDITLKHKDEAQWFGFFKRGKMKVPYIKKKYEDPSYFYRLDNGVRLSIGMKRWHSDKFQYKKPVIVICLFFERHVSDVQFTEHDIRNIVNTVRRVAHFIAYRCKGRFNGKELQGYGKRASRKIALTHAYEECAITTIK